MKNIIYGITYAFITCLIYYSVGYLIYKFTSLEFIQSEPCQSLLMFLFFISFVVGFKICEIIERLNNDR